MFLIANACAYICQWLQTFKEFPPRQESRSFNLEQVMEKVMGGTKQ
jgi:arylsulfatase